LNEDNSWLLLAVRNMGSCFASPILLLLRNGATKYHTLISIIRQAPSMVIVLQKLVDDGLLMNDIKAESFTQQRILSPAIL
jgi:hypothetical protein